MSADEATLLAGVPNAPSVYAPTVNPELARQRQKQVIARMVDCGFLEESENTYAYRHEPTDIPFVLATIIPDPVNPLMISQISVSAN